MPNRSTWPPPRRWESDRELDRFAEDLAILDRDIAQDATDDEAIQRLLTITGVNLAAAAGLMAAIGRIDR